MKALTHYTFSVGVLLYTLSLLGRLSPYSTIFAIWLSLSVNYAIDALGHSNGRNPSRTRLTHSVFTAPVVGVLVASASAYVSLRVDSTEPQLALLGLWTAAGALVAMAHLFLDSLTQAGVYRWKNRVAIAHFKYDNPVLNAGFILAGLGFTILALQNGATSQLSPIPLSFIEEFTTVV